ncbi:hypothetical protein HMPREF9440_01233 [Sutterella parvirubra YIT 11816]|uniref:Uncharacterized protein n=1 Tax=Sutterella parvirubra YIT 11816 TaxID=762967 RepID=H3KER8_9BURK|nr:hypothetical protein HMPREF9440_01233 [Sutterella parvirubra YIT 11816]
MRGAGRIPLFDTRPGSWGKAPETGHQAPDRRAPAALPSAARPLTRRPRKEVVPHPSLSKRCAKNAETASQCRRSNGQENLPDRAVNRAKRAVAHPF